MSEPQVVDPEQFVDLLIFEESLRQEYTALKSVRRKYTVAFSLLLLWNVYFLYSFWFEPSYRRYLSLLNRICCLVGLSTLVLFYLSGLYNDTLVQPRKFIPQANRALRHYNVKLVITNRGWLRMFRKTRPGEGVRLILGARAGSMAFREGFEEYRREYWQEVEKNMLNEARLKASSSTQEHHHHHHNHRRHQGSSHKSSSKIR